MRNLKRALSLALASVMLLGMMVVGAGAASYPDVDGEKNVEAISVLNAVGAMIGDENGNFNPDKNVTRNEMAAVVARLLLGPDAEDYAGTVPFTDVPDWAVKYVAACYDNGIVNGISETEYNGDGTITAEQAATMMLRALGYENITDTGADWAKRAVAKANEISLFKGVTGNVTATLTRNDVAQLSLNTLKATCVKTEVTGTTGTIVSGDVNVTLNGEIKYTEVESDEDWADAIAGDTKNGTVKATVQLGEKLYEGKLELSSPDEDEDDLGRPASVWTYKNGDPIFTIAKKADYTLTLKESPDDLAALLKLAKKGLNGTNANITLNGDLKVDGTAVQDDDSEGNEPAVTPDTVAASLGAGDVVEIYLNEDDSKVVDDIFVSRYVLNQITDVDDDVKDDDAKDGVSCYVDLDDFGNNTKNTAIPGFNAETYVKDAYVALLISEKDNEEKIVDSYIPEIVESSIDTNKNNKEFAIGKDKYTVAAGYTEVGDGVAANAVEPGSDNTYALYLDKNGYILGIAEVEVETTSIDDVYYLDTVWAEEGKMNSSRYYAQLVALDGTVSEVELEAKDHKLVADQAAEASENEGQGGPQEEDDDPNSLEGRDDLDLLSGMLVTISDKKVGDSKKGDKKYNLNRWAPDKDWETYSQIAETSGNTITYITTDFKKDLRDVTVDGNDYRLNKDTVYLFVEKGGKDLAVTRYVGGVSYDKDKITGIYVITEEGEKLAKYVIVATDDAGQKTDYSSDLIFIQKVSTTVGKGYYSQEVYLPDGTKETWKIDKSEYEQSGLLYLAQDEEFEPAFFAYDENDDGYYDLDVTDLAMDMDDAGTDWSKKTPAGVLSGVTFSEASALFEGTLTVTVPPAQEGNQGTTLKYITVDGADFKDLHSTKEADGEYDKTVKSLDALAKAMKDGKAGTATLYMNVSEDGAVSIFVTNIAKATPASPTPPTPPEESGTVELTLSSSITTVTVGSENNWTAAITGDSTDGWTITLTQGTAGAIDNVKTGNVDVTLAGLSNTPISSPFTQGTNDDAATIVVTVNAADVNETTEISEITVATLPAAD